jgi:serine protease AprX
VSAEAQGSSLVAENPSLHASGSGADAYATLNGTSMATGMVSGAVALVLEANKGLSPLQVKMALQSSATFMPEAGLVGAGAGSLNTAAAIGAALNGPIQQTTSIGGETVVSSGVMTAVRSSERAMKHRVKGGELMWGDELMLGHTIVWGSTIVWGGTIVWGSTIVWGGATEGNPHVGGDTIVWGSAVVDE